MWVLSVIGGVLVGWALRSIITDLEVKFSKVEKSKDNASD